MKEEETELNGKQIEKPEYTSPKRNVLAIVSVICGIGGLFISPLILGPIAIIIGAFAYSQIKSNPNQKGKELAIFGILLGIIDIIYLVIFVFTTS